MEQTKGERIRVRAYEIWESEGQPDGQHEEHWRRAEQELGPETGVDHPGMLGDGTEEQNLGQPGHPEARITEQEVTEAFGSGTKKPPGS